MARKQDGGSNGCIRNYTAVLHAFEHLVIPVVAEGWPGQQECLYTRFSLSPFLFFFFLFFSSSVSRKQSSKKGCTALTQPDTQPDAQHWLSNFDACSRARASSMHAPLHANSTLRRAWLNACCNSKYYRTGYAYLSWARKVWFGEHCACAGCAEWRRCGRRGRAVVVSEWS